jgi:wobble nucleotide-excising tRNase
MLALKAQEILTQSVDWKVDDIGMVRQSIDSMRDSRSPIFNQMVREHNQKIHDYRQGIKR